MDSIRLLRAAMSYICGQLKYFSSSVTLCIPCSSHASKREFDTVKHSKREQQDTPQSLALNGVDFNVHESYINSIPTEIEQVVPLFWRLEYGVKPYTQTMPNRARAPRPWHMRMRRWLAAAPSAIRRVSMYPTRFTLICSLQPISSQRLRPVSQYPLTL